MAPLKNVNAEETTSTADMVTAADEDYVFNLKANTTYADMLAVFNEHNNVRLVLQEDWLGDAEGTIIGGQKKLLLYAHENNHTIIDLNGHTWCATKVHELKYMHLEIYDSSPDGSGVLNAHCLEADYTHDTTLKIYGGTVNCYFIDNDGTSVGMFVGCYGGKINAANGDNLRDIGGNLTLEIVGGSFGYPLNPKTGATVNVAPWMDVTYDADGKMTVGEPYADYAVSTSNIVSGQYNTTYGLAWEISATELNALTIPADKTYYLWGRNADGGYEQLNLRCNDGKNWQSMPA